MLLLGWLTDSYSAIMRGAVLYKLGLDFVKERIARRHYGHAWNPNFIQGHHPEFRKFTNVAGWVLCSNAVDYYVKKVQISLLPLAISTLFHFSEHFLVWLIEFI